MAEVMAPERVRSGSHGTCWLNGELASECYGLQIKVNKTKEQIPRCGAFLEGHKLMSARITGTVKLYNATSVQRVQVTGVSFDDLTLADWEAAKIGVIEAPFTADDYTPLET